MKHFFSARRWLCFVAICAVQASGTVAAAASPTSYPTADAAASALVQALKANDQAALRQVLGDQWRDYIPVDSVDRDDVETFIKLYDESHKTVGDSNTTHLEVGKTAWTLPIPIAHRPSGWSFDLKGGHDEIVTRQIGDNELSVAEAMLAYYDAQRDYASQDRNSDSVPEYARKLISSPGKHDGLYWPSEDGGNESPLGPYFAASSSEKGRKDFHGYHFRILFAQGASAPGGAYGYKNAKGQMTSGFALVAWPARYGESGVMTFMVSHDGEVFEKDLGKETGTAASKMSRFDPDSSWSEVKPAG
jgi:hypothetical protein